MPSVSAPGGAGFHSAFTRASAGLGRVRVGVQHGHEAVLVRRP